MASGGHREGAGRKPSPSKRVTVSVRVKPATAWYLSRLRRDYGVTLGAYLDKEIRRELLRLDMLAFEKKFGGNQ